MYKNFYHMTEEPFQNFPLPDLFFKSRSHQSGWRYLLLGIKAREPYLLVTGEYGAGKTLLCLRLLKGMAGSPGHFPHTFISTPNSSYLDILKKIGGALGVPDGINRESALQREILEVFEDQETPGPFFLILDDVQDFDADTLHNLRLFANFSCNGVFPFRLILFAHTSFLQRLKSPTLCSLDQRIKRRYHLASLQPEETKEYIYFRLLNSGARGRPFFNDSAVHRIHTRSDGVPRVINNLCDACLLIGVGEELSTIDERTVHRAEAYLGMSDEPKESGLHGMPVRDASAEGEVLGEGLRATEPGGLGAEEGIDFMKMPDSHSPDHLEQVVPEWEKDVSHRSRFDLGRFLPGRKGRYILAFLLLILIFLFGFFWQRYGVGVSLGLTSSSEVFPSRVDGDVALWLNPKSVREPVVEKGAAAPPAEAELQSERKDGAQSARSCPDVLGQTSTVEEQNFSDKDTADDTPPGRAVDLAIVPEVLRFSGREYTLVISSCRKKESAIAVLDSLGEGASKFDAGLGQIAYGSGPPWWVVHQGTFASRAEAVAARQELQLPDALVRKLPYLVVDSRIDIPQMAEERLQWLKGQGEHPFFVNEGKWVDVCLGRYDTARRAAAQLGVIRSGGSS